MLCNVFKIK